MVDGHKIIAKFRGGKFFPGLFMKTGDETFFRGKAFGYDTFHCGIPVTDEISEDDLKDLTEKVQKLTDKAIDKIDKAVENKTKEVLTV